MSQQTTDQRREHAAVMAAQGTHTDRDIAHAVGVTRRTIQRWRQDTSFQARVGQIVSTFATKVVATGIAERQARVDALNDRWERMKRVIDERATSEQMQAAAGGKTGLLTVTWKQVGAGKDASLVEEYAVDTGLLRELRAHEQQAAQELGQWTEKSEQSVDKNITFTISFDRASDT